MDMTREEAKEKLYSLGLSKEEINEIESAFLEAYDPALRGIKMLEESFHSYQEAVANEYKMTDIVDISHEEVINFEDL